MKIHTAIAVVTALTINGVFAQSSQPGQTQSPLIDASQIQNRNVVDPQGKKIGDIKKILVDPQTGRIRFAVVEVDTAWSISEPTVPVPWGAFSVSQDGENDVKLTLNATKEKLQGAPKWQQGDAARIYSRASGEPIYTYWSATWTEERPMSEPPNSSGSGSLNSPSNNPNNPSNNPSNTLPGLK